MNLEYRSLLQNGFDPESRVWVYQSNRLFGMQEALEIEELMEDFAKNWKSHGTPVKGAAFLFFGQFIILMADETATGVSGCSTDSSVHFIKSIEQRYQVHLFDRTTLAFVIRDRVQLLPLSQLNYAIGNGFIDQQTLYFNNTVQTKTALENNWLIPVSKSWLAARITTGSNAQ